MNKHWKFIGRYGDNDNHWWRFRYSPKSSGWTPTGIMLETSGGGYDESDRAFNILSVSVRGRTLGIILPQFVKPYEKLRVFTPDGDDQPRSYIETFRREFGFRIVEGSLCWHYGAQTHEWPGCKSKHWFFPWRETRHIRHSLYDDAGDHFADMPDHKPVRLGDVNSWKARAALEEACSVRMFLFAEKSDGDLRIATCRTEEREWRHGRGVWRWLLAWKRNKVSRSLSISYSDEVGRRKGSWKGGTLGTGIEFEKGELTPIEAFTRHCKKEELVFITDVTEFVGDRYRVFKTRPEKVKAFMGELMAGITPAYEMVRKYIYRAGFTPIHDTMTSKTRLYPTSAVNAARYGIPLPDEGPTHLRVPAFDKAEVVSMMHDGGIEGQWSSDAAIAQIPPEVMGAMLSSTAELAPEVQEEIDKRFSKSTAGRSSIKKSHRGEGENFVD